MAAGDIYAKVAVEKEVIKTPPVVNVSLKPPITVVRR